MNRLENKVKFLKTQLTDFKELKSTLIFRSHRSWFISYIGIWI